MSRDAAAVEVKGAGPPLSVAFVSPGWPPDAFANGVVPCVDLISRALRLQGHRATVLSDRVVGEFDESTVRRLGAPGGRFARTIDRLAYRASAELGMRRPMIRGLVEGCRRLIDEQGLQLLEMEEAFGLAKFVRRRLPIPVVVRLHGPWFLNGPLRGAAVDDAFRRRVQLEKEAILEADSVTAPSLDVLERTRGYYGLALERARVISNPAATVPVERRWRVEGSEPETILFVGRFDLHKGGDIMIRAFAEVARRRPLARLRFVGPDLGLVDGEAGRFGIEEFIRREAAEAADRIERPGGLPNSELEKLRREARVTVVCSRYETFGMTLTEAITAGCPTVATRAGALPEIVRDGVNGLLCAPEDPLDLAGKICTLLGDEALAARLGRQAALDGERHFEAGPLARESSDHYRRVIEAGRRLGRGVRPR